MKESEKKQVLINPAVELPAHYIDNPAFNFYAAACAYKQLSPGMGNLNFVDAFADGDILKKEGRVRFGAANKKLIQKVDAHGAGTAMIIYTSFHRAEGLYNRDLFELIDLLGSRGIEITLLDLYDSTTHYLGFHQERLKQACRFIRKVVIRYLPAGALGVPRFPIQMAGIYGDWLEKARKTGTIKDNRPGARIFPYQSSFGCPYQCLFCKKRPEQWTGLPARTVLDDLDYLKNLGYDRIFVTDPYANFDKDRFKAILSGCADKKIGLHFVNGLGLGHLDTDTVCLLKHTTQIVSLSPESLLDPELTRLKKPFDRQTALEKIEMITALGLPAHLHFIIGLPGQNREAVNRSLMEIWRLYRQNPFIPRIQQYRSRDDLFISQNKRENIYPSFSPGHSRDPWLQTAHCCFDAKVNARRTEKIIINVSYRCNNRCRFCAVADRQRTDGDFSRQKDLILDAYKQGIRRLDIDGGEPFLYERLFDLLDTARNYAAVTVTTNGRMLAYKGLAQRLSDYPNVGVLISVHGPDKNIHDRETNSPGSFQQTVRGITNAVKTVSRVGINTTVTRHNYHSLPGIAEMVRKIGIKVFNIQWYTPFGNVDRSLVPPDDALAIIRDLIATYNGSMKINMINFLYCQAPDLFGHMIGDHGKADRKMLFVDGSIVNLSDFLKEKRIITKQCVECEYKILCNGFWNYGDGRGRERVALLDIIPGYACNRNCVFCALPEKLRSSNPTTREIIRKLESAVAVYCPEKARIGGGEPTIRKDLFKIMGWLKRNGAPHITVQTNGLRLADPRYLDHLILAGADKINISLPAYDEVSLAGLTGVKGSLALIQRAIQNILGRDIGLALDILLTKTAVTRLDDMVSTLSAMGADTFNFWFISIEEHIKPHLSRCVPRMSEASEALIRIFNKYGDLSLLSYYIPFCFFPDHVAYVWHPADENAFVVTPEKSFFLEQGRIDLGVKTKRCSGCRYADNCFGIRENYLEVFGDSEIHPI